MKSNDIGIKDVAYKAGVSVSTVSKVLKNYPNISKATKDRVLKVVQETGYIPNSVASALASKTKNRIALFICINDRDQQIDELNMLYILGAFSRARELNQELVTIFDESIENYTNEECAVYFRSIYVDSIIVFGLNRHDEKIHFLMQDPRFKVVVVDADIVSENVSCVMIDHCQGQYDVASQVVHEGDKVLYLAGRKDGYVTDMRLEGMKRLQKERNLQLDIRHADFSEERAYEIVRSCEKEYDDIICASDLMAIGARRALGTASSVRLSGFDGIRLMGYVAPDVLTCRQDFRLIGSTALEEAERLRQGDAGERIILPYEIRKITM